MVKLKIENAPIYYDDDYEQGYKQAMNDVEIIVKKYDNDGWIDVRDKFPEVETTQFNKVQYLCAMDNGFYQVLSYCEGWNCFRDCNGDVENTNEIFSVLAWKEIEEFIEKDKSYE